jgi:hypothetical protein
MLALEMAPPENLTPELSKACRTIGYRDWDDPRLLHYR